jgi:hypothetical protein
LPHHTALDQVVSQPLVFNLDSKSMLTVVQSMILHLTNQGEQFFSVSHRISPHIHKGVFHRKVLHRILRKQKIYRTLRIHFGNKSFYIPGMGMFPDCRLRICDRL